MHTGQQLRSGQLPGRLVARWHRKAAGVAAQLSTCIPGQQQRDGGRPLEHYILLPCRCC